MKKRFILIIIAIAAILVFIFLFQKPQVTETNQTSLCKGTAACLQGTITKIIDGDTIEVNNMRVRLSLVDAAELETPLGQKGKEFVETFCPKGSPVIVDQDDLQMVDAFGRLLGMVKCVNINLNEALLQSNLAAIDTKYCPQSEFKDEPWAKNYGC